MYLSRLEILNSCYVLGTGVRSKLMDSEDHMCPMDGCHETGISPDSLIPNKFLRTAVTNFLNETGYTKAKKLMALAAAAATPPQQPVKEASPPPEQRVHRGFYRAPRDSPPRATVRTLQAPVITTFSSLYH